MFGEMITPEEGGPPRGRRILSSPPVLLMSDTENLVVDEEILF